MAPRADKDARFRGNSSVVNPFATDHKGGSDKASRAVGTIFAASLLRPSSVLFRRSHAHGQCVDAERMATIRTSERDIYGDVDHSEDFLKERGQERRASTSTNSFPIEFSMRDKPGSGEPDRGALTQSDET